MKEQRKAILGAILAGLGTLVTALGNGGGISMLEWLLTAAAVVGTYAGVYKVPNAGFVRVGAPETSEPIR